MKNRYRIAKKYCPHTRGKSPAHPTRGPQRTDVTQPTARQQAEGSAHTPPRGNTHRDAHPGPPCRPTQRPRADQSPPGTPHHKSEDPTAPPDAESTQIQSRAPEPPKPPCPTKTIAQPLPGRNTPSRATPQTTLPPTAGAGAVQPRPPPTSQEHSPATPSCPHTECPGAQGDTRTRPTPARPSEPSAPPTNRAPTDEACQHRASQTTDRHPPPIAHRGRGTPVTQHTNLPGSLTPDNTTTIKELPRASPSTIPIPSSPNERTGPPETPVRQLTGTTSPRHDNTPTHPEHTNTARPTPAVCHPPTLTPRPLAHRHRPNAEPPPPTAHPIAERDAHKNPETTDRPCGSPGCSREQYPARPTPPVSGNPSTQRTPAPPGVGSQGNARLSSTPAVPDHPPARHCRTPEAPRPNAPARLQPTSHRQPETPKRQQPTPNTASTLRAAAKPSTGTTPCTTPTSPRNPPHPSCTAPLPRPQMSEKAHCHRPSAPHPPRRSYLATHDP
ncbi:hypothetical protein HNY73_015599 [Argiope bruennichi]|uniref:Uncharacterized protein n=1 Tax=Argiope bruennichi TaxID=94029 RepID=A0A8T0EXC3_ARGBR|nr:hypothetical protein HNY73_015599 [Argiope bruennichi]